MPITTCPSCGERTCTIAGWEDLDRCAYCARPPASLARLVRTRVHMTSTSQSARPDRPAASQPLSAPAADPGRDPRDRRR